MTLIKTVLVTVLTRDHQVYFMGKFKGFLELSTVTHLNRTYESTSNQISSKISIVNLHTCIELNRYVMNQLKELLNVFF